MKEQKPRKKRIFGKVLLLVIVLSSFSLAEKIVDGVFELEKANGGTVLIGGAN